MATNIIPFPRRPANDNPGDIPPFDPANPTHLRAWRTIYLLASEHVKQRLAGGR